MLLLSFSIVKCFIFRSPCRGVCCDQDIDHSSGEHKQGDSDANLRPANMWRCWRGPANSGTKLEKKGGDGRDYLPIFTDIGPTGQAAASVVGDN
jgi:hypothetical protein